jgi:hypothetical protein
MSKAGWGSRLLQPARDRDNTLNESVRKVSRFSLQLCPACDARPLLGPTSRCIWNCGALQIRKVQ